MTNFKNEASHAVNCMSSSEIRHSPLGAAADNMQGFSLIEVLVSLAIMAIVMTTILVALSQGVTAVGTRTDRLVVFMRAKQLLVEAASGMYEIKPDKPLEKKFEDPTMTCTYSLEKMNPESSLAKFTNLKIARVTAQASGRRRPIKDSVGALIFSPEPKKQEQKQQ